MPPFVQQLSTTTITTTTTVPTPCNEQLPSIVALPPKAISRSYQYRKILKPMLERKRRARINKCLDELKHLLSEKAALDADALTKLEKADILELTVQQLQQQRRVHSHAYVYKPKEKLDMAKYWAGFQHCVLEVSGFVGKRNVILSDNFYDYILRLHIDKCRSYHQQKCQEQITEHVWRPWQCDSK